MPAVLLSVRIYELLAMLPQSTPGHIPCRLSVIDPTVAVPPAAHTLGLPPVVDIGVASLRSASIHAINTEAVKVVSSVVNGTLDPPVPICAAEIAIIFLNLRYLAGGLELLESLEYRVDRIPRECCLKRVGFGLDECSEVIPSS